MDNPIAQKVADFFASHTPHTYQKGQALIQAGMAPSGVFYLTEGQVDQYDIADTGEKVIVNSFKPGAFFPMSWAINSTPNLYVFEANTKTTATVAPQAEVVAFLHDNPDVAFDLLSRVYRGTDGVLRRLAHLMGGSARSRLLFELVNIAKRFGTPGPRGVTLQLTAGEIAHRAGMARETVSRTLGELKAEQLIDATKQGLIIPSIEKLEAALGNHL